LALGCIGAYGELFFLAKPNQKSADVLCSLSVIGDFTHQVLGAQSGITVRTLVGPNQDPHLYEPTPKDIVDLLKAKLILVNGLGLEAHWLQRFTKQARFRQRVIEVSRGIIPRFFKMGKHRIPDPHAWHNVAYAKVYVQNIVQGLAKHFPNVKGDAHKRAARYQNRLSNLEAWVLRMLAPIPCTKRLYITTHDGLGYLRAYSLRFITPLGPSTDAELSARQLQKIIHAAKKQPIQAIFLENMTNPATLKTVARETGLKVGGTLYSDSLSPPGGPAPTYIRMVRHNMQTIIATSRG
jgi:ABC-type Zn uptake system ZnuABC Zn-binding protein ZnuA